MWELVEGKSVGLCRCGQSGRKPFCDKTHFEIGFDHPEAVAPDTSHRASGLARSLPAWRPRRTSMRGSARRGSIVSSPGPNTS